jgi:hypothetical protein
VRLLAKGRSHNRCREYPATRERCQAIESPSFSLAGNDMMRVLNLDMDLFLSDVAYHRRGQRRLNAKSYKPWTEPEVRHFLESSCLLSTAHPVSGRVVTDHDEAFFFWRELIEAGVLEPPFHVVHADAHADLGLGDASYVYIMEELLSKGVEERRSPRVGGSRGINLGNYLAFAIACRWLSSLTYVHHPSSRDDLNKMYFQDFRTDSGFIELKYCRPGLVSRLPRASDYDSYGVISREPPVPFTKLPVDQFSTTSPFDLVVLSRSPGFTPQTSDVLVDVVRRYMNEIRPKATALLCGIHSHHNGF